MLYYAREMMRMIRLIATDLDGTLLGENGQISPRTLDAIHRFVLRGGLFVPVTGRPGPTVPDWILSSRDIRYYLHCNGGRCVDNRDKSTVFVHPMAPSLARRAFESVASYEARWNLFASGQAFRELHAPFAPSELIPMLDDSGLEIEKLDITPIHREDRSQAWQRLLEIPGLSITSAYDTNIEINTPEASKGSGVSCLADMLGIQRDEIMAFGDGLNDLSLLECAGFPVAMENAVPQLKAAARYIAPLNTEDGEAQTIEAFALTDAKEA